MIDLSKYHFIEKALTPLAMAVHPLDLLIADFIPLGDMNVMVKNHPGMERKNPSGYRVFFDLPDAGSATIQVNSDYYLPIEIDVDLPSHNLLPDQETEINDEIKLIGLSGGLLAEIHLVPNSTYPFPAGATLVRGEIVDATGAPVQSAKIHILNGSAANPLVFATNGNGHFTLFCNRITETMIRSINGKDFGGSKTLRLQASDTDLGLSSAVDVLVEDNKTTFQKISF